MSDRVRIAHTLSSRLSRLGILQQAVLRRARLPQDLLEQASVQVRTVELFALYEALAAVVPEPAFGLDLGTEPTMEGYDPIAIAALCARSLRDAMKRISRYKQVVCAERLALTEREDGIEIRVLWARGHGVEPALLVDQEFARLVNIGRRGTETPLNPNRVELRRRAAHDALYEQHFGCPVRFESECDALVFDRIALDLPFVRHDPAALAKIAPGLEAELDERPGSSSTDESVKRVLKRQLAGQRPFVRRLAAELRVSTRTLQRRLNELDLTFQQLLGNARHELARHYLLSSPLELAEVAYLLGYEDANSFFRAFGKWEGLPPGQWRADRAPKLITPEHAPGGLQPRAPSPAASDRSAPPRPQRLRPVHPRGSGGARGRTR